MSKKRLLAFVAAAGIAVAGSAAAILPTTSSSAAAACSAAYSASAVYTRDMTVSHNGRNWTAKWWTQGEAPSTGGSGVWADKGACGAGGGNPAPPPGGGGNPAPPPGGVGNCNHPNWTPGTLYPAGSIVKYTNGQYYRAKHENPGYDPIISTWYWEPFTCSGNGGGGNPPPPPGGGGNNNGAFPISESQFNQMFPSRNAFYSYAGLIDAMKKYPNFTREGDDTARKREAAAFLANVNHETGGLVYIEEIAKGDYCQPGPPLCAPGKRYYGRGPIQLSWNYNYDLAGRALGLDLLNNPDRVASDSSVAWQTGIWYWMTQNGPSHEPAHAAIIGSGGFGGTIRAINGSLECGRPGDARVQKRVEAYNRFVGMLGVSPGNNVSC